MNPNVNINELVDYIHLSSALPFAMQSCAKYTQESLSKAIIQNPVSDKMLPEIYKKRIRVMETLTKEKNRKRRI